MAFYWIHFPSMTLLLAYWDKRLFNTRVKIVTEWKEIVAETKLTL